MKERDQYYFVPARNAPPPVMLHPSCPGCGRVWENLEQQRSVGGASVEGPMCRHCQHELERITK
jgi:hypothetical protein